MRLLVIEDDVEIGRSLSRALRARGHEVEVALTGAGGVASALEGVADAVVLDLGLPDVDGVDVLRRVRAESAVPVVVATARDDDAEVVSTLDAGADDYVVKPYSADQLEARLRAVVRRAAPAPPAVLRVGGLVVDTGARTAVVDGRPLELSRKEFDLLVHLVARPGLVVSRRQLAAAVWGEVDHGIERTVDVHISWLRRKLGETAVAPRYLRAVRGVGVKVVDPGT